ncbi:MAG: peptidoglycan DD-metalloendopeptidase family protein [bacterium]
MLKITTLLMVIVMCFTPIAIAKRFYKYQDDDGIWHYSDKKPDTDKQVESRPIKVESSSLVKLIPRGTAENKSYWVVNQYYGPVEVRLSFARSSNVRSTPSMPVQRIIPSRGDVELVNIIQANKSLPASYTVQLSAIPGDPNRRPPSNYHYQLPFKKGLAFSVSQAWNGAYSHTGIQSRYAVDIALPEGTPILASRDGIVMEVERDFYGAGTKAYYLDRANMVRILHEDGSMAIYAHLKPESSIVYPGQAILAGEQIGESGNTGFSTGPHLHFAIQSNTGMQLESMRFLFIGSKGQTITPDHRGIELR